MKLAHPRFWLPTVLALVIVALLWSWVAKDNPYVLPKLSSIGTQFLENPDLYLANALTTFQEAIVGLAFGTVAAVVVAVAVAESRIVWRATMPLAVILSVTPVVAIAPALVVAFGFGMLPKYIVTGLITFFPVLMNTVTGLRSVDRPVLQVFRTVNASRLDVLLRLRFPSALPYFFAALRVVFPLSLVGAIVAEFAAAGAKSGLGTLITVASSNSQLDRVFAAIACLAVMGSLLLLLVTAVERRVLSWHESQTH